MLFSIVVLSYNRPEQIDRILAKLQSASAGDFNLIIKDDCSPRLAEIEAIVKSYSGKHNFDVILHENKSNLGYDRNLLDAFNITESEYVFLLSDDDFVEGERVFELSQLLSMRKYKLYFTPYKDNETKNRINIGSYSFKKFHEIIYNSILFSGLIFDRETVLNLPKNDGFLSSCIYTQVFLTSLIIYTEKKFGEASDNLLFVGGDGENFFGKNSSAINKSVLENRKEIASNLKYQQFLIKTVREISAKTSPMVFLMFMREYNLRLVSYLFRLRFSSLNAFYELKKQMNELKIKSAWYVRVAIFLMPIVPGKLAGVAYDHFKMIFKKSG